jgi:hypothetical protein
MSQPYRPPRPVTGLASAIEVCTLWVAFKWSFSESHDLVHEVHFCFCTWSADRWKIEARHYWWKVGRSGVAWGG